MALGREDKSKKKLKYVRKTDDMSKMLIENVFRQGDIEIGHLTQWTSPPGMVWVYQYS